MSKIYLASKSKARKQLLKSLGLKFKVLPAKVKEVSSVKGITYAKLVRINAQKKAEDVAARIKEGVVIAADTIMVQDKKIFGKPDSLNNARKMLKEISGKPQQVYTGVAVIKKEKSGGKDICL